MSYLVLARKWRPRTFKEVVGQSTVTRTLQNALSSGRIGHAFLLSGARGVGKTTTARILAKALNCGASDKPTPEPCLKCPACVEIAAGTSLDVQEIDGATHNGVEQVRELRESARYNPARDRFKVWIIDEVHMLSSGAFNALLKTLEEPPPRVKFIFATTEIHKLPDTILSRCQHYDFRLIPAVELEGHLTEVAKGEGVKVSAHALSRIARAAEGSLRDALSLFDQVLSFSGSEVRDEDLPALLGLVDRELLLAASRGVAEGDARGLIELVGRLADHGADYRHFCRELLLHFRDLLLLKLSPPESPLLAQILPDERERMAPLAANFSEEDLLRSLDVLGKAEGELRWAADQRVTLELALLKLVHMRRLIPFADLVSRVERLAGGAPSSAGIPRASAPEPPAGSAGPRPAPSVATPKADPPSGEAGILGRMLAEAKQRPSLAQALRDATAREEGGTLVLTVLPDFLMLARTHAEEYQGLATKALARATKIRIEAFPVAAPTTAPPSPQEIERDRLMTKAKGEVAVQEVLDLFDGKVVDVREAKPAKETA
jgi:DNA polymerase-3 subunit gamma/tau